MKCYTDYALPEDVRTSRHFYTPKNLFLKCLLFLVVFIIGQFVEILPIAGKILSDVMQWSEERLHAGMDISYEDTMQRVQNLLENPEIMRDLTYCTGLCTVIVLLFCRYIEGRKLSTMGFHKKHAVVQYLAGMATGFILFSLVVLLSWAMGGIAFEGLQSFSTAGILVMLGGWIVQGMSEEVLCRGYFMTTILRHYSVFWAVLINAIAFGLLHAFNQGFSLPAMLNLTVYAVMISVYVLRTNNLWGACAIHSIWNFMQGNFYGLPVSGTDSGDTIFIFSLNPTSAILNGGTFGLEASLPCTIVLIAMTAVLLLVPMPFLDTSHCTAGETK